MDHGQKPPLSERLRTPGYVLTPKDIREMQSVERTVQAKYVYAGSNGVFEHWWKWGSRLGGLLLVAWFAGVEWTEWKRDLSGVVEQTVVLAKRVDELGDQITDVQRQVDRIDSPRVGPAPARRTATPTYPTYPRDERFALEPNQ